MKVKIQRQGPVTESERETARQVFRKTRTKGKAGNVRVPPMRGPPLHLREGTGWGGPVGDSDRLMAYCIN